jgi:hypothetical protein
MALPASSYTWSDGSTTIGSTNPINVTPSSATNYSATAVISGCPITTPPVNVTVTPIPGLASTGSTGSNQQGANSTYLYTDASCNLIAKMVSTASSLGAITSTVTIDGTVQAQASQPYLQRHYTFTPATTTPATLTLYATQTEFNNFNAAAVTAGYPLMPTTPSDPNASNVRVSRFAGTPFVFDAANQLLTPTSVTWDATNNWWAITIAPSGLNEFFIHTGTIGPLSISLNNISAVNAGNRNRVDWSTTDETNASKFELERSTDGINFKYLGTIVTKGQGSTYSYWDEEPAIGMNYYRLKMYSISERYELSKTVNAFVKGNGAFVVEAYPNPVSDLITVRLNGTAGNDGTVQLTDVTGKLISSVKMTDSEVKINMSGLAQGVYLLKYSDSEHHQSIKVNKL